MSRQFRTSVVSRERNRVHAQRTRQRKKEQMQGLQGRVTILREEQIMLRQAINEQSTANILVGLFARNSGTRYSDTCTYEDPQVEELLKRPIEDIPDASKIPELPALILPGFQASKKSRTSAAANYREELPGLEGIDYELLERDRAQCTPQELDKIRRERNRMHAKRTRDRKRLFTEKLAELSAVLQQENDVLKSYLSTIDPDNSLCNCSSDVYVENLESPKSIIMVSDSSLSPSDAIGQTSSDDSVADDKPEFSSPGANFGSVSSPRGKSTLLTLLQVAAAGCFDLDASPKLPLSNIAVSSMSYPTSSFEQYGSDDRHHHAVTDSEDSTEPTSPKRRKLAAGTQMSVTAVGS